MSGSVSLISSLVDSSVDLISGVVIWVTNRLVKKTDPYLYPQGMLGDDPHHEKTVFGYAKTTKQISRAVTKHLISAFVYTSQIVQSLFFLNLQASII